MILRKFLPPLCLIAFALTLQAYGSNIRCLPELDAQIGQMIVVGFRGLDFVSNKAAVNDIRNFNIGGVVLFNRDPNLNSNKRNIESPQQLKALIQSLQEASIIPLFISIDQEGGLISRLTPENGFPESPSHQTLGTKDDLDYTYQEARKIAATLKGMGINLNLAPVVDICANPGNFIAKKERTFSQDPQKVAQQALAYIEAHHEEGVLCVIKHFPGHGSSTKDSHKGMVDVTETWDEKELIPFKEIIEARQADMVMTAHIFQRNLDPKYPATLSHPIIDGLLRKNLGYKGVVITDDIQMNAIREHFSLEETLEALLNAGVDMIIVANTLYYDETYVADIIGTIKKLIAQGRISKERIGESFARIQKLKQKLY